MASPAPAAPPAEPRHSSRLATTRSHLAYLANPKNSPAPRSLVTRSSLKTFRYVLKFVFWRLLRYAKYTLIAAGSAALAGTVIGTALPWVGALVFPSVPVAAAMGATTALIKFTWRHRGNHFRAAWAAGGEGRDARKDEARDAHEASEEFDRATRRARRAERSWKAEADAF
ncbi:hypothetical protein Rt10032_c18g5939 [Rhodotorula toruloides]|uniref:Transmembrane protein n=1 Tax=Rhodotorula toruloides TaxID=5286 RepID=A0A511KNG7_RHOTO|nr:hypothetical protein Rt10032_c18g5939 [Rhodotorula toruloides]